MPQPPCHNRHATTALQRTECWSLVADVTALLLLFVLTGVSLGLVAGVWGPDASHKGKSQVSSWHASFSISVPVRIF